MNIVGLLIMKIDKSFAKIKGARRVPEKNIWMIAIMGGSIGTFFGMYLFRHKTKHIIFRVGIPFVFLSQLIGFIYVEYFLF